MTTLKRQLHMGCHSLKLVLTFFDEDEAAAPTLFEDESEKTVAFLEKEQVTILICDIRNFTSLSERIGDSRISAIIKAWSREVARIVESHHGRIDKFIGDAVMALWPGESLRKNVHLAMVCAVEINKATIRLGEEQGNLPEPLGVCAAVNTGEAILGNIGVDGQRDFTAVGDAVNVAFRLEGQAGGSGRDILVGGGAAAAIDSETGPMYFQTGQYALKGKAQPVAAMGTDFDRLSSYLARVGG